MKIFSRKTTALLLALSMMISSLPAFAAETDNLPDIPLTAETDLLEVSADEPFEPDPPEQTETETVEQLDVEQAETEMIEQPDIEQPPTENADQEVAEQPVEEEIIPPAETNASSAAAEDEGLTDHAAACAAVHYYSPAISTVEMATTVDNASGNAIRTSKMTVSWMGDPDGPPVYQLLRRPAGGGESAWVALANKQNTGELITYRETTSRLQFGQEYEYAVRCLDEAEEYYIDYGKGPLYSFFYPSGSIGDDCQWKLTADGKLSFTGSGIVAPQATVDGFTSACNADNTPWASFRERITQVEVGSGITALSRDLLVGCENLTTVSLPDGLTTIGDRVFMDCENLSSAVLPGSVVSIGARAFAGCKKLNIPDLPEGLQIIGNNAFEMTALTEVTLPASLTQLGNCVFQRAAALRRVVLPENITAIPDKTFYGCTSLSEVEWTDSVEKIGIRAFFGCESLEKLTIPNSVTNISNTAFMQSYNEVLSNLTLVVSPDSEAMRYAKRININYEVWLPIPIVQTVYPTLAGLKVVWEPVPNGETYHIYRRSSGSEWSLAAEGQTGNSWVDTTVKQGETWFYTVSACVEGADSCYDEIGMDGYYDCTVAGICLKNQLSGIQVSWDTGLGAQKYNVYRKQNGGSWGRIQVLPAEESVWVDTTAQEGVAYTYTVRASYEDGMGGYDPAGVNLTRRSKVIGIKALNQLSGIRVSWTKLPGAQQYDVYRKQSGAGYKKVSQINADQLQWVDTTAQEGIAYTYTVRAVFTDGTGGYDPAGVNLTRRSKVIGIKALNQLSGIRVSWTKLPGAQKYDVYRKQSGVNWKKVAQVKSDQLQWVDTTAQEGVAYTYTVRAVFTDGTGGYDPAGVNLTRRSKVIGIKALNQLSGIRVSWTKLPGAQKYDVYRKQSGVNWKKVAQVKSDQLQWVDTTAQEGVAYTYTVRAVFTDGTGGYDPAGVNLTRRTKVIGIKALNQLSGIRVSWTKLPGAQKYDVYRKQSGVNWKKVAQVKSDQLQWVDTTAQEGVSYTYTVRAVFTDGTGGYDPAGVTIRRS